MLLVLAIVFVLIQLVPYGRAHDNPPVTREPDWDSPRTAELAKRACGDCHSNETTWPWYSKVAPFSWLMQNHVDEGREHFNFSEMNERQRKADEAAEELDKGEMPPWAYLLAHPEAKLTNVEKRILIQGLRDTFGDRRDA